MNTYIYDCEESHKNIFIYPHYISISLLWKIKKEILQVKLLSIYLTRWTFQLQVRDERKQGNWRGKWKRQSHHPSYKDKKIRKSLKKFSILCVCGWNGWWTSYLKTFKLSLMWKNWFSISFKKNELKNVKSIFAVHVTILLKLKFWNVETIIEIFQFYQNITVYSAFDRSNWVKENLIKFWNNWNLLSNEPSCHANLFSKSLKFSLIYGAIIECAFWWKIVDNNMKLIDNIFADFWSLWQ